MADEPDATPEVEKPIPPGIKVFATSNRDEESVPAGEPVTVGFEPERETLPTKVVTFAAPTVSHLILMSSLLEGAKDDKRQAELLINWFFSMLEPKDQRYFQARLFDQHDTFDLGVISEVVDHLMEQWSGGRPTRGSSGSSGSRKTGGKKSTAKRHGRGAHHSGGTPSANGAASSTGGPSKASAPKAARSSGT